MVFRTIRIMNEICDNCSISVMCSHNYVIFQFFFVKKKTAKANSCTEKMTALIRINIYFFLIIKP